MLIFVQLDGSLNESRSVSWFAIIACLKHGEWVFLQVGGGWSFRRRFIYSLADGSCQWWTRYSCLLCYFLCRGHLWLRVPLSFFSSLPRSWHISPWNQLFLTFFFFDVVHIYQSFFLFLYIRPCAFCTFSHNFLAVPCIWIIKIKDLHLQDT